jgi:K+-sensing histidine kinase KdpD
MAPDVMEKIFLPFEQVGSFEKQIEGTGLGLAISHKVVSLMGATINVESELGVGSTFWFDVEFLEAKEWTNTHNTQKGSVIGFKSEKRKIEASLSC